MQEFKISWPPTIPQSRNTSSLDFNPLPARLIDDDGSMPRFVLFLTSSSARKPIGFRRVRALSTSTYQNSLVSVGTIRDNVSKFVVRSRTTDPFINLAIEDHLLRTSDITTHILFTYVNRPCVVIGRNQNPWLEANLATLKHRVHTTAEEDENLRQEVLLVRRRSGGGTVFHDEGNLNYSFIVPNDNAFNRNKHAEMVVQAIQNISPATALQEEQLLPLHLTSGIRVNDRHDIVMPARAGNGLTLAHEAQPVKVSGSAYKLIRGRALHHGTLLFSSPNLKDIGSYLHSPARGFIRAKGVESVRSPIGNLRFSEHSSIRETLREQIEKSIAGVFVDRYPTGKVDFSIVCDSDTRDYAAIDAGIAELKSQEWRFLQTPAFVFTNRQLPEESFKPAPHPPSLPASTKVILKAKHGIITESHISLSDHQDVADAEAHQIRAVLQNRKLHEITNWEQVFAGMDKWTHASTGALIGWLAEMFPPIAS
jgi:lipoate---protein ligase